MSPARWRSVLSVAVVAIGVDACGRPATEAECEEIVERIARLQIEADRPGRPEAIAAEVAAFKERERERVRSACVGKPVTERALACARSATRAEAVEACFR